MIKLHHVLFFCFTFGTVQASKGCIDDTWEYHGDSHTCFKYINIISNPRYNWIDARADCELYKGGIQGSTNGHLIRIDDLAMNTLIKEKFIQPTWSPFIGLHYQPNGPFRWDGFPGQPEGYTDFKSSVSLTNDGNTETPYVGITTQGWDLHGIGQKRNFFCQYDARIQITEMSCPAILKETSQFPSDALSCQFYYDSWISVEWYSPDSPNPVARCRQTGQLTCTTLVGDYVASWSNGGTGTTTLTYNGAVTRQHQGAWKCSFLLNGNKAPDTKSCDISVYATPENVTCTHKLEPDRLEVTCSSSRIYPEAACQWKFRNTETASFKELADKDRLQTSNNQYEATDNGGTYFKTSCQATFTSNTATFLPGKFTTQAKMYPLVAGSDLSSTEIAYIDRTLEVDIVSPDKPVFQYNSTDVTGSIFVDMSKSHIELTCEVASGEPTVQTTNLLCEFPFTQLDEKLANSEGTSHVMNVSSASEMDGKTCTCWGNHLTGNTDNTTVTFHTFSPPTPITCRNESGQDGLNMTCRTERIFPAASCQWEYKSKTDTSFKSLSPDENHVQVHVEHTDNQTGETYFTSMCSIWLPSNEFEGNIEIKVKMYPDISGINEDKVPGAFHTVTDIVYIDPKSSVDPKSSGNDDSIVIIIGVVVAVLVSLIIAAFVFVCVYRRRSKRGRGKGHGSENPSFVSVTRRDKADDDIVYSNGTFSADTKPQPDVIVSVESASEPPAKPKRNAVGITYSTIGFDRDSKNPVALNEDVKSEPNSDGLVYSSISFDQDSKTPVVSDEGIEPGSKSGLAYSTVCFDKDSERPVVLDENKGSDSNDRLGAEEPVEYAPISQMQTLKIKQELDAEELKKKNTDVYSN